MTAPKMTTTPTANDETTCHVLPCSVDYQGMAPTHLFFKPRELEPEAAGGGEVEEKDEGSGVLAASFRGRGLLAGKAGVELAGALLEQV